MYISLSLYIYIYTSIYIYINYSSSFFQLLPLGNPDSSFTLTEFSSHFGFAFCVSSSGVAGTVMYNIMYNI